VRGTTGRRPRRQGEWQVQRLGDFRDRDELAAAGDLPKQLQNAVLASKFLIDFADVREQITGFGEISSYDQANML